MPIDRTFFPRLRRLFSTGVIIRNIGGKQLKVADVENIQAFGNLQTNSLVDRFTRMYRMGSNQQFNPMLNYQTLRLQLYADYENMDTDGIISSVLDILSEECTLKGESDEMLSIRSSDDKIQKILYDLYYNILNIEFNLPMWIRSMCKYGDFYMHLKITELLGISNCKPLSVYDMVREEGMDPDNPYYTRFRYDPISLSGGTTATGRNSITFEQYEIAHFRLLKDTNYLPYGRAYIEPARKLYKQLCLKYDSKIWTPDGYTEIQYIKAGDTVYSYDAANGTLKETTVRNAVKTGNKKVFEIKTPHRTLNATAEHPILLKNGNYVQVSDLSTEDYVVLPYIKNNVLKYPILSLEDEVYSIDIKEGHEEEILHLVDEYNASNPVSCEICGQDVKRLNGLHLKTHGYTPKTYIDKFGIRTTPYKYDRFLQGKTSYNVKKALRYIDDINIPEDFYEYKLVNGKTPIISENILKDNFKEYVRFIGFMLGDGWIDNPTYSVCFSLGDRLDKSIKYVEFLKKLGLHPYISEENTSRAYCRVGSKYFTKLLNQHQFYTGTSNKIVPSWIYELPNDYIYEFLMGFVDADGCVKPGGYQVSGINKLLIEQLCLLAQRIGLSTTNISKTRSGNFNKNEDSESYLFVFREDSKQRWKNNENSYIERIVSIVEKDYEDVYDIEVDDDLHNFISDGIVAHNCLLEDAMLLHRIMRAPERRVFYINVGNIPPSEVNAFVQNSINQMKKTPFVDPQTGDYNLKFNVQNMLEDYYIPIRPGDNTTKIDTAKGLEYAGIEDVEYIRDKMLAALKVPKAFLNYSDELNGKSTISSLDVRFSRTVEQIQRTIVSELKKLGITHLYTQGYEDDCLNFELSLNNPSIIYEQEKIALLKEKFDLIKNITEGDYQMVSTDWLADKILNMSEDELNEQRDLINEDASRRFRYSQIKEEGNDPAASGVSYGTKHDLASIYKQNSLGGEVPDGYDEKENIPGPGRPKEKASIYTTDKSAFGRDPVGKKGTHDKGEKGITFKNTPKSMALENAKDTHKEMLSSIFKPRKIVLYEHLKEDEGLLDERLIQDDVII